MTEQVKSFSENDIIALAPNEKIGIVATINDEGLPHLSLITTVQAKSATELILGEFSKGLSKDNMQKNPKIGFLLMTMDKSLWRGKALWNHLKKSGPDYEMFNQIPMFRYNTYFGINTVHYLDLISTTGRENLPMGAIIRSSLVTKLAKGALKGDVAKKVLLPFGEDLFNNMGTLKYISYINEEGYPEIIPLIQCGAADNSILAFSPNAYGNELKKIPKNADVAVFALNLKMESILVRGKYKGIQKKRGFEMGTVRMNWVYNSMPPAHGQVYPQVSLEPVQEF